MKVTSTAFEPNTHIPSKYTCDGQNCNPPLTFSGIAENASSLVLIVDDPDAPAKIWLHWLIYDIPPGTLQILENNVPENSLQGENDGGGIGYHGPCPPTGTHRYFFRLYALDTMLGLQNGASRVEVEEKMQGHIIASAELVGLYSKN